MYWLIQRKTRKYEIKENLNEADIKGDLVYCICFSRDIKHPLSNFLFRYILNIGITHMSRPSSVLNSIVEL